MKKILKSGLLMMVAGAFTVSCADYNDTYNFKTSPDPSVVPQYTDLGPVKSYLDKSVHPNMTLGAQLKLKDFNDQAMYHAAAINNFDDVFFGTDLMSGKIINGKGSMNFISMNTMVSHAKEIGATVYGSPIAANSNQPDDWFKYLTSPIEIIVDFIEEKTVDFSTMATGNFSGKEGTKGTAQIKQRNGKNQLYVGKDTKVRIVDGFTVSPLNKYTIVFYANADKDASFNITFSGNKIANPQSIDGKYTVKGGAGKKTKFEVECRSAEGETDGYLRIESMRSAEFYIESVEVGYYPDNHRDQTQQEVNDTIHYALNTWCDALMRNNAGCIKTFSLIDEPIDVKAEVEDGIYDLKHATKDAEGKAEQIFWQDIFGSENYAPTVATAARNAYQKYQGDPNELKFFISETGLEEQKKFQSLMYWIGIWDTKGAKIDGIDAKLNLIYSEDETKQQATVTALDNMLTNLASTGKLIRVSNFDIKYQDADGNGVSAKDISDDQRQKLADFYAYVIKSYMSKIPSDKQAGICKGSMPDTNDPVGLWSIDTQTKDWVRTATYEAFCKALSGK